MGHTYDPGAFLGLTAPHSDREQAAVWVLPIPYEATVSYGAGTAHGPAAILDASRQVELYDREFDGEPALDYGIHTLPDLVLPNDPQQTVTHITRAVTAAASTGKLILGLGGEHTVSVGFGRGLLDALGGPLTVVQIDAHADLRDRYEDNLHSHACVARRLLEDPRVEQVLQLGIRSVCREEVEFARTYPDRVHIWYAEEIHAGDWQAEFVQRLASKRIFLTLDVDGLDPSIVPATGTPEPDGLTWSTTLEIMRLCATQGRIVGLDCVELAPQPGLHHAEFTVAKLLYKALSYALHVGQPSSRVASGQARTEETP